MSYDNFIKFLQDVITMVNPDVPESISMGESTVGGIYNLACNSGKVNRRTLELMSTALRAFPYLIERQDDFACKPLDFSENDRKRRCLEMTLNPHC